MKKLKKYMEECRLRYGAKHINIDLWNFNGNFEKLRVNLIFNNNIYSIFEIENFKNFPAVKTKSYYDKEYISQTIVPK